ncbi:MAG TPA: hypothetical protein PLI57_13320, partial [Spirochaetota bacterium]|nr:hypothetical protein [Spirochaetota bacterium]
MCHFISGSGAAHIAPYVSNFSRARRGLPAAPYVSIYSSGSDAAHMCQFIRRGATRVPIRSRYERVFSVLVYSKREF